MYWMDNSSYRMTHPQRERNKALFFVALVVQQHAVIMGLLKINPLSFCAVSRKDFVTCRFQMKYVKEHSTMQYI